jgi:hypothetical protein
LDLSSPTFLYILELQAAVEAVRSTRDLVGEERADMSGRKLGEG